MLKGATGVGRALGNNAFDACMSVVLDDDEGVKTPPNEAEEISITAANKLSTHLAGQDAVDRVNDAEKRDLELKKKGATVSPLSAAAAAAAPVPAQKNSDENAEKKDGDHSDQQQKQQQHAPPPAAGLKPVRQLECNAFDACVSIVLGDDDEDECKTPPNEEETQLRQRGVRVAGQDAVDRVNAAIERVENRAVAGTTTTAKSKSSAAAARSKKSEQAGSDDEDEEEENEDDEENSETGKDSSAKNIDDEDNTSNGGPCAKVPAEKRAEFERMTKLKVPATFPAANGLCAAAEVMNTPHDVAFAVEQSDDNVPTPRDESVSSQRARGLTAKECASAAPAASSATGDVKVALSSSDEDDESAVAPKLPSAPETDRAPRGGVKKNGSPANASADNDNEKDNDK